MAADVVTYTDEDLEPGKTLLLHPAGRKQHWCLARGRHSVAATAAAGVPDAPVLTATAASRTSIDLSWTVPDDNGTPITGYDIQQWGGPDMMVAGLPPICSAQVTEK